jgi:hypothetical protein
MAQIKDGGNNWKETKLLLDTGAEVNIIDYALAQELDLVAAASAPTPSVETLNQFSYAYCAYEITLRMQDSRGYLREINHTLYAVDIESDPRIIIGMPVLDKHSIGIHGGEERNWYWNVEKYKLLSPEEFARIIEEESHYYAAIPSDIKPTQSLSRKVRRALAKTIRRTCVDKTAYQEILDRYRGVLEPTPEDLSKPCPGVYHRIETIGEPPHGPIYNLSQEELRVLREYLDNALTMGWIRESESPAGSPILFVPKSDGTLRLCVDYRGLNKITIKNRYPLPLISEILDRLSEAKVFTKLDLVNAYHRIAIHPDDVWKTAFRTRYGHFEYAVMPFGLTNAPATFQAWINKALAGYIDDFCIVYLDDILIFSKNPEEHKEHLEKVLKRLQQYALYCNQKKCLFFQEQVNFLGYVVTPEGVEMDQSRIATVAEWPTPRSYRDVQIFIGFANFYRRFIHRYSRIIAPLTGLFKGSKKGVQKAPWQWPPECEKAFTKIKEAFTKAPLLRHFDPSKRSRVETDASISAVAGVLSQIGDDGHWHPIAFYSQKLDETQSRYETHDQELMAIVEAFRHWRHYLEGVSEPTQVLSDHQSLMAFMNTKKLSRRQARWAMELNGYDLEIKHQAGKRNPADGPSRRPDYVSESDANTYDIPLKNLQRKLELELHVHSAQAKGGKKVVRERDAAGNRVPGPSDEAQVVKIFGLSRVEARNATRDVHPYGEEPWMLKQLVQTLQLHDKLATSIRGQLESDANRSLPRTDNGVWSIENDLLRYEGKLYIPRVESLRQELLRRSHNDPLSGHFGQDKTKELLRRHYYWPELSRDVDEYVLKCGICQRTKPRRHKPYGLLKSLPEPTAPWKDITMDFITDLPPSKRGRLVYDSILVIVDRKVKMGLYVPTTKKCDAEELARILLEYVVARFGAPNSVISDRGPIFTSEYWSELCFITNIAKRLSTAFHPQTDGQTERQNQTLIHWLRCFVDEQQTNWASLLPMAEFAYNNSYQASIGTTPFRALYGYDPTIEINVDENGKFPSLHERWSKMEEIRKKATDEWKRVQERQKKYVNKNRKELILGVNQLVLLNTKNLKLRTPKKKLSHKYIGPFKIIDVHGSNAYRLELPSGWRVHPVFNVEYLEPYRSDGRTPEMPPPEVIDDAEEWEIEAVLNERRGRVSIEYLVKWTGYDSVFNEWVPEKQMGSAQKAIEKFRELNPESTSKRTPGGPEPAPKRKRGRSPGKTNKTNLAKSRKISQNLVESR